MIADTTMSVVMGSVLLGIGIGVYYSHHGTAGGTDIVAAIMSNLSDVSMGRVMMIVDISIVALSFSFRSMVTWRPGFNRALRS